MGRKKIALKYIGNESSRRRTLETRRKNLASKANELSILCNAKACVLVYGEGDAAPKVYTSNADAVDLLNRYKTMPEGWFKTAVNQEDCLSKQLRKLRVEESKVRDPEIRVLLHKAMLGSDLPGLKVDELAGVSTRLEEILKSMGESIAKISGQPPVLQPRAPYVPGNDMDMGSSAMYQASLSAPFVTGSMQMGSPAMNQAPSPSPYVTDNVDMGCPAMNQAPSPSPYVTGSMQMGSPAMYQAPSPSPYVTDNVDMGCPAMNQAPSPTPYVTGSMQMGSPVMYQAPSPIPYATGSMHMGSPAMYQVPPQQMGWLDTVRSGRDLDVLAHNGYITNGHDGAGTSASAGYSANGHDAGSSGGMKSWDVGFNWQSGGVDPEESSWSLFPPM